ncbi:hypothetical protein ACHAWF_004930 [Thalassiosira exigua]
MNALLFSLTLVLFGPSSLVVHSAPPANSFLSVHDQGDRQGEAVGIEYESKIYSALLHHASESHRLLERSLTAGVATASAVEIGADGSTGNTNTIELKKLTRVAKPLYDISDKEEASGTEEDSDLFDEILEIYPDDCQLLEDQTLKDNLSAIKDEDERFKTYDNIRAHAYLKARLDPDKWYEYTHLEMTAAFNCKQIMLGHRPIYRSESWTKIRELYHQFSQDYDEDELFQFNTDDVNPQFPTEPFQSTTKGRSLRAARDIRKGELIYKPTNNTIVFVDGGAWRDFIFKLYERNGSPYDKETACDFMVWSWVNTLEDGRLAIFTDLSNENLLNSGADKEGWDPPNLQCGKDEEACVQELYAIKDVKKGDELLVDYLSFAQPDWWNKIGL